MGLDTGRIMLVSSDPYTSGIPEHGVIPWRTRHCNRGRVLHALRQPLSGRA